jgi:hypothetical protein
MIDLTKLNERKEIVINLQKQKGLDGQKAQVALCLDFSGSMRDMYISGEVQEILERIVPIAMQFDDNGEFELFLFENDAYRHKNNVSVDNVENIVKREILNKYEFGGTSYAPVINAIKEEYCPSTSKSFFGKLFGSKKSETTTIDYPVYVIFITDGENDDRTAAVKAITEASKHGIFFQFVGIGRENFRFLSHLDEMEGRFVDNANFFKINDISKISDQELYSKLFTEFPDWLKLAKQHQLIK